MNAARLCLLVAAAAVLLWTCSGCQTGTVTESDRTAAVGDEKLPAVKIIKLQNAKRGLRRTTTQPATVHAFHRAEIYAKVSGYLADLKADIGKTVTKTEILAVIDVPEMEKAKLRQLAMIEQYQAAEAHAKAKQKAADAAVAAAVALQKQAVANVSQAEALVKADKAEFERIQALVNRGTIESRLRDEVQKKLDSSEARKEAAVAGVAAEKANLAVAKASVATVKAEHAVALKRTLVAKKTLDEMKTLMAFANIRAPFDGVVTARNVDKGDLVRNLQTSSGKPRKPLFVISQVDKLRIRVAVPENDAPLAKVGRAAHVKFRSLPHKTFSATISRTSASLDPSTRTMIAEIDLDNDGSLIPGMYGEATIVLENRPQAIILPATAVRHDESGKAFVYVVQANSTIRTVPVVTGPDTGKTIAIVQGLDGTERVVGATIGRLQANQKVRILD